MIHIFFLLKFWMFAGRMLVLICFNNMISLLVKKKKKDYKMN